MARRTQHRDARWYRRAIFYEVAVRSFFDSNDDGIVDLSDAVHLLAYLFSGGAEPPCLDAADADDSEELDISDAIFALNYLFQNTASPPAPFPGLGVDPDGDLLGCGE